MRPGRRAKEERKRRAEERKRFEVVVRAPKRWERYDQERMSPGKLVALAYVRERVVSGY